MGLLLLLVVFAPETSLRVERRPDDCGTRGCAHELVVSGDKKVTRVVRALDCQVRDGGFACVERLKDDRVRVVVRYRIDEKRIVGRLDHFARVELPTSCRRARAREGAVAWPLPSRTVGYSVRTPRGFEIGRAKTVSLTTDRTYDVDAKADGGEEGLWYEVRGQGWVLASALRCT